LKILIIQNKRIGDVLISSLMADNIKKNQPKAIVNFFCYDYTLPVIKDNPFIDHIISVSAAELKKTSVLLKFCKQIRKENYDVIVDPYSKFQSRLMCLLSGANITAGFIRKKKILSFKPYSLKVLYKKSSSLDCGKTIEDRMNLLCKAVPLKHISYEPKIYMDPSDSVYDFPSKPFFIVGILGSVPSKSLPAATMAKVVDHISKVYPDHVIIFNYAPHQREEATIIYSLCKNKEAIDLNLYESDLSKFLMLLSKASALISNEGGSVHMAKALNVPTFTIYSPFITKEHWNSFENLPIHQSIHLAEKRPDLYKNADRKRLKEIEKNPGLYYSELTSDMIWSNLKSYLKNLINT
jgi:ADP-heptose:LPS heptosyltransferase